MKQYSIALIALLGLMSVSDVSALQKSQFAQSISQMQGESYSEESTSEESQNEENVQLNSRLEESKKKKPEVFPAYMHGFGGYKTYMRDTPDRFEGNGDDTLMRSMYENYATEGSTNGQPNGHFWVEQAEAKKAATEVVATHLKLGEKEAASYVKAEWESVWGKYDVNEEGKLDIDMMPAFLRSICGTNEACVGLQ